MSEPRLALCRNAGFHLGVDRPRTSDNPASINDGLQDGFPTRRRLAGENDGADAVGPKNPATFSKCLGQLAFVKRNVVRGVAQLVRSINDDFCVFRNAGVREKIRMTRRQGSAEARRRRSLTR